MYHDIYNLQNTVLRLVYREDLYVPPAYPDHSWFLLECVVLSMLFTPEGGKTRSTNPNTNLGLPLHLHLHTQSELKYFLCMVLMMAHMHSLMDLVSPDDSLLLPHKKP